MKKQLLLLIVILWSCTKVVKEDLKTIDFKILKITVPSNWERIDLKGIDSFVSGIKTGKGDTVVFDIGDYSYDLTNEPTIRDKKYKSYLDSLCFDTKRMIFSNNKELDKIQGIYFKEFFIFDTIDCYKARYAIPKVKGRGITGFYIDSLNSDSLKVSSYGYDLDPTEQEQLLKAFKTIKIKFCP
ncbi:hypothetical protein I5M27_17545 [Adhaeribacter sp. BT258]|uniref:Lipoprotein n=1 Tax=Adhaeribacter terrigena TaxID=2793070 RepID=A0ABS1C603_9BACT|nr:hypothetical protein [Adhaeribacter terrigena]MBK0404800.1 hypothetical protein [Adhaeribacter terrigena]